MNCSQTVLLFVGLISFTLCLHFGSAVEDEPSTSSPDVAIECEKNNGNCTACVANVKCLYCYTDNKCKPYPTNTILPGKAVCKLSDARWGPGLCWFNLQALVIAMACVAAALIVGCCCCVYCCCCRTKKKTSIRFVQEDEAEQRKKEERQQKHDMKMAERRAKHDDIRRKYGLMKDEVPYQKFDDA